MRQQEASGEAAPPGAGTNVWEERRWVLTWHWLFAGALAMGSAWTLLDGGAPWRERLVTLALAGALAAWYGVMVAAHPQWWERARPMGLYLVVATALLVLLLRREPNYFILIFSFYPQALMLLPGRLGYAALAALALLLPWAAGAYELASISPTDFVGVAGNVGLALLIGFFVSAIAQQSEQRREMIVTLERARADLARAADGNARLLARARADAEQQAALYRAAAAVGAARTPRAVVKAVGQHLGEEGLDRVALLATGLGGEARVVAAWERPGLPPLPAALPLPGPPPAGREPRWLAAGSLPAAERQRLAALGIAGMALLPLGGDGTVLLLASAAAGHPGGRALRAYRTIAPQVALALDNQRLLAEARYSGILEERQRMAREIHDTIAQGLTGVVTQLEAAEGAWAGQPAALGRHLEAAKRIARESLAEARRSVWALRPQPLERQRLPDALAQVAERWSRDTGVAATVVVTGPAGPLHQEVEAALLRVAQEALANAGKHASASRVSVTLSYMEDLVSLDVRDDGVGFDPEALRHPPGAHRGGFGLTAMRERLARLAGTLEVESAPGRGTAIAASVPTGGSRG